MTKLHKMSSYIDHAITLVNYTSLYHITMCVHAAAVGGHVCGGGGGGVGSSIFDILFRKATSFIRIIKLCVTVTVRGCTAVNYTPKK